jgi:hypothetical protein
MKTDAAPDVCVHRSVVWSVLFQEQGLADDRIRLLLPYQVSVSPAIPYRPETFFVL